MAAKLFLMTITMFEYPGPILITAHAFNVPVRPTCSEIFEILEPFLDFGAHSVTLPRHDADVAKSAYAQHLKSSGLTGKHKPEGNPQEPHPATSATILGNNEDEGECQLH